MSDLSEMRKQLRDLRKEHVKPVSRMRKGDIAAELEKLRGAREETPAAAATPSAPTRMSKAAVESIKEAKRSEFPVKPEAKKSAPPAKKAAPAAPAAAPAKKKMTKADLMKMISDMDSDSE
jgi:hypothetical protein